MRRAQVDGSEQPIRNLFSNPGAETAGGAITVRSNLFSNPALEAVGGVPTILRHNLATNPRMANTSLGGYQTQTLTAVSGLTGVPEEITTAVRVAYPQGTSTNPGAIIMPLPNTSTQYSLTAWVLNEGSVDETIAMALKGATSGGSQVVPPGVWTRLSWTMTTPSSLGSGNDFGVRISSPSAAGSFLVTGVTIEQRPEPSPRFFDGDTVWQNIIANPTFASNVVGGWTPISASLARVTNQGGDGHACEITQTIANGTRNTAVWITGSTYPAGNYTVSFDIKGTDASFTNVRSLLYESSSTLVRASGAVALNKDGEWHRYVFNFTADGTWDRVYMEVQGVNIPLGTKAWLDRAVVEKGTTSGEYYEGTGDYTFAWTGTAGASTSAQRGTTTPGLVGANQCIVTRTGQPGRYSARAFLWGTTINDSGIAFGAGFLNIAANKVYTISFDVTTDKDRTVRISVQGAGTTNSNSPTFTQVAGVTVRRSHTFYTNASATGMANVAVYLLRNDNVTGTIDVDNILIEEGLALKPYFDGSFPASADFTYDWNGGTANGAVSRQRATGLSIFGGGSNSASIQSSEWSISGTKSLRIHPNSPTSTGTQDTFAYISMANLQPGIYTIMGTLRIVEPMTTTDTRARRILAYHSGQYAQSAQAPNVPGIYPLRVTFKVLDGEAYQSFRAYHGASSGNPDVWWDNFMVVEGEYTGDYLNPDKHVYSKWVGTAGASQSVGYPPSLWEIAGKPDLDFTAPTGGSGAQTVEGFGPRTLYMVYQVTDPNDGSWQVPIVYGTQSSEGITLQTNVAGNTGMAPRVDLTTGGGTLNGTSILSNARTGYGRHVAAVTMEAGMGAAKWTTNGNHIATRVVTPGTVGMTNGQVTHYQRSAVHAIRTLVYYAEHDDATRVAISRYLGNQHGANIA